jgi:hypothetical protein
MFQNPVMRKCTKCEAVLELNYANFQPIKDTYRFRSECRECGRKMSRAYKAANKEHVNAYTRDWKKDNAEHVKEYNHDYFIDNQVDIQARNLINQTRYYRENPAFKFAKTIRKRMLSVIKNKASNSMDILGCPIEFFTLWIDFQMYGTQFTFENHGSLWQMDHVAPCASYDLTNAKHQLLCFHWSNHQPLGCMENLVKNNKIDINMIFNQSEKAKTFLTLLNENQKEDVTIAPIYVNVMFHNKS